MINKTEQEIMKNWKGDLGSPIVSVCSTTYNHEKYISEALDSFLMQETDFAFEVIVRDDASPDKTADIIREYEKKYPNIIKPIYEIKNGFQKGIRAMPVAIQKAQGEYIALCEGDDYWTDSKKLQAQKDFLEQNFEYVICYHNAQPFDENGILNLDYQAAKYDLSKNQLLQAHPIYTLTTFFRNIIVIPPEYCIVKYGDMFLWSLLGEHGKGKYIGDIKPAMYRVHDNGVFSKKTEDEKNYMLLDTFYGIFSYFQRINNSDMKFYFFKRLFLLMTKILIKKVWR
jgi:glycosyltransferase involved in cell wall biosynthesis